MRILRGAKGRFRSEYDLLKLRVRDPEIPYTLLVFDPTGDLVAPLNEWYRLRTGAVADRTRETYLAMLLPFFGFLLQNGYAWDAKPDAIREFTRRFLIASGCTVARARNDGYMVRLRNGTPFSPSGLAVFLSATRDLYSTLGEGQWNARAKRFESFYSHDNPMYSQMLLRWRREHLRAVTNAGAPDHSGVRGTPRGVSARKPIGFFRTQRQVWNPPVASEARLVRSLILAAINFMTDHAPLREKVILRIMLESGARLGEVLGLTAGGYRRGRSRVTGVSALVPNKGTQREIKPIRFEPETDRLLQKFVRVQRSRFDPQRRTRIDELDDVDPIFLSRYGRRLGDSGFRSVWTRLCKLAEREFRGFDVALPHLRPHFVRHAHVTVRFEVARELYRNDRDRYAAATEAIEADIMWTTPETKKIYDHSISHAEALEETDRIWKRRVQEHPRSLAMLASHVRRTVGAAPSPTSLAGPTARARLEFLADIRRD